MIEGPTPFLFQGQKSAYVHPWRCSPFFFPFPPKSINRNARLSLSLSRQRQGGSSWHLLFFFCEKESLAPLPPLLWRGESRAFFFFFPRSRGIWQCSLFSLGIPFPPLPLFVRAMGGDKLPLFVFPSSSPKQVASPSFFFVGPLNGCPNPFSNRRTGQCPPPLYQSSS